MYIYNRNKIKEVKRILQLENYNNEEMCEIVFKKLLDRVEFKKYFTFINKGSDRAAYKIKGIDIVVKINYTMENYHDGLCFQGAIEKEMFEKYRDNYLCYEIYGISDNYSIIFCEYLDTNLEPLNLLNLNSLDLYHYVIKEMGYDDNQDTDDGVFYSVLEEVLEDFLNIHYDNIFEDIHIDNIGLNMQGEIKVLDLGYGDGELSYYVAEKLLSDGTSKIYGLGQFNSAGVDSIVDQFGGYHNEIVA